MNKLIVLGNGFDLARGYETRFSDYFKSKKQSEAIDNFFLFILGKTFFQGNELREKPWKDYLKVDSAKNWMDVELVLNHFLVENGFYERVKNVYESNVKKLIFNSNGDVVLSDLNSFFTAKKLSDYPLDYFLLSELNNFETNFCEYVSDQQQRQAHDLSRRHILNEIIDGCNLKTIMTFNYTYPATSLPEDVNVCFVHGCCNNQVIIGIDITNNEDFRKGKLNYSTLETKLFLPKHIAK